MSGNDIECLPDMIPYDGRLGRYQKIAMVKNRSPD